jgi:hypothetical protein
MTSNTFNSFKFQRGDGNSTLTCEISIDTCQEIVDEFIAFMRGCGFMDVSIYSAMENAVAEYAAYSDHVYGTSINKAIKLGLHVPMEE